MYTSSTCAGQSSVLTKPGHYKHYRLQLLARAVSRQRAQMLCDQSSDNSSTESQVISPHPQYDVGCVTNGCGASFRRGIVRCGQTCKQPMRIRLERSFATCCARVELLNPTGSGACAPGDLPQEDLVERVVDDTSLQICHRSWPSIIG